MALVVAVQAFHLVWVVTTPGGDGLLPWFGNLLIDSSHALSMVLVFAVAARHWGSRLGWAWSLLALGLLFGQFGESSWSFQELALQREVPFPSVSDIGYVGAYPPVFLGLLLMPQAPASGFGRLRLTGDALLVMSATALLSWFLIIEDVVSGSGEPALAQALSVFYPVGDLGIIFAAFILVARVGRSRSALVFSLLAGGYAAAAFSDSLYAYLAGVGYEVGQYVDIGWVAANSLISLAALAALASADRGEPHFGRGQSAPAFWPSLIPYAPMIPLSALFVVETRAGASEALAGGFLAVLAIVVLRQMLTIYENVRLNSYLAELAASLEYRVKQKSMELLRRGPIKDDDPAEPGSLAAQRGRSIAAAGPEDGAGRADR